MVYTESQTIKVFSGSKYPKEVRVSGKALYIHNGRRKVSGWIPDKDVPSVGCGTSLIHSHSFLALGRTRPTNLFLSFSRS